MALFAFWAFDVHAQAPAPSPPPPGAKPSGSAQPAKPVPPPAAPAQPAPTQPPATSPPPASAQPPDAIPAAQPAPPGPVAIPTGLDPVKEREIIDAIVAGKDAVKALDLASAQMFFEQAFAKCDQYGAKGPLLARVYMALGSLFAGYLQQVPQGTEFMKMALLTDPLVEPEKDIVNAQVTATFNMVRERLGVAAAPRVDQPGAPAPGLPEGAAFWVMKHQRITSAKRMYPLGIYIETNPMVAIQKARLYFRLPSDRNYQVADMQRKDNLYGILIGCDAIALLDPEAVYYFIEVIGGDGSVIAREGEAAAPVEIRMVPDTEFQGTQPNLPGLAEQQKCNPDEAAPCPPWDPHCKDIPCVTTEDCLGGKICQKGYCVQGTGGEQEEETFGAVGLLLSGGVGIGAGIVRGTEQGLCGSKPGCDDIELATGFSPSWMFTRFTAGYFVLDNLALGLFIRLQHISDDGMSVAGPTNDEPYDLFPMWGPTLWFFFWGKDEFFGPGQLVEENGELSDDQGLRAYVRAEVNCYGAMYHSVSLRGPDENGDDAQEWRQHASGKHGAGLGFGALYGLHRNIDMGAEAMFDALWMSQAYNFDFQLYLQLHF